MKLLLQYLKQRRRIFLVSILFCAIFAVSFLLYHLPIGAVIYPALLCTVAGIIIMVFDFTRVKREHEVLQEIRSITDTIAGTFPRIDSIKDEDYQQIIQLINEEHGAYRTETNRKYIITDEKWLSFVIEQVLSNALKYTPAGSISITLEPEKKLCIRDTGIGIAPEDLPRIFENGYTGYNGRADKKASGIGLYLCKRICTNLGHTITAKSIVDVGTVIVIDLAQTKIEIE